MAMPLVSHLRHHAIMPSRLPQGAQLPNIVGQRFLNEDMLSMLHRTHRRRKVSVIGRRNGHRVDLLMHLVHHHAKIFELRRLLMILESLRHPFRVQIAHRHEVLLARLANGIATHATTTDHGAIDLVVRRLPPPARWQRCGTH